MGEYIWAEEEQFEGMDSNCKLLMKKTALSDVRCEMKKWAAYYETGQVC